MEAAPEGAIYKRPDGLVIIDPERAAGHPEIVDSCPYGAIHWNEEAKVAQKCTGCAHLMEEGWTQTRCTQSCPTGALKLVLADEAEMSLMVDAEALEIYKPELGTSPRVYYKNLHRWNKVFVAGSAYFAQSGDCAGGCEVTVARDGAVVATTVTNNFGDFLVDVLEAGTEYTVAIEAAGHRPVEQRVVSTLASLTLPAVALKKV
jgi:ferredoxin